MIRAGCKGIEAALICSVVPKLNKSVESLLKTYLNIPVYLIGKDLKVPIVNEYKKPQQVGQDRLVCAFAAKELYGVPVIIIDFGTAITFDVVSVKGAYEGGMIVPGMKMSTESLFQRTALLPRIDRIRMPRNVVGKNTRESILSGIIYGYGAMCCGLIDQIANEIKVKPKIVITGGHTDLMNKLIQHKINYADKDLVFKGIKLLYFPEEKHPILASNRKKS